MSNSVQILDGNKFSQEYTNQVLKKRCSTFIDRYGRLPTLDSIAVGEDPGTQSYIKIKEKFFKKMCLISRNHFLPEETTEAELLHLLSELNSDNRVDGILVHMPLPAHISSDVIIENIKPSKDVDGLSPKNIYSWVKDLPGLIPATALASLGLLKYYHIPIAGKHAVVVGRSTVIGKPVSHLLLRENATITICHSKTTDLGSFTQDADILVSAVGKPNLIKQDMVKKGAAIIDVGINSVNGKIVGDVDYNAIQEDGKAGYITPVPGGVGPVTVAMLTSNLLLTFELQHAKDGLTTKNNLREYYSSFESFLENLTIH